MPKKLFIFLSFFLGPPLGLITCFTLQFAYPVFRCCKAEFDVDYISHPLSGELSNIAVIRAWEYRVGEARKGKGRCYLVWHQSPAV